MNTLTRRDKHIHNPHNKGKRVKIIHGYSRTAREDMFWESNKTSTPSEAELSAARYCLSQYDDRYIHKPNSKYLTEDYVEKHFMYATSSSDYNLGGAIGGGAIGGGVALSMAAGLDSLYGTTYYQKNVLYNLEEEKQGRRKALVDKYICLFLLLVSGSAINMGVRISHVK
jgi:hypothetical protein